ncbi:hypothetical protein Q5P01_009297 [Channa striata]|uniref:VWFA domain-containing protein n=1 Tax=Channa striata TaxID=64152 RepID=A0AA88N5M3_CHASR|nr:hypothetical protein Q5P01_009297 [Channa striata]
MPILLFLLDTSASMNQRTYLGTTYLDVAKGAVEVFMKLRARDPASRGDRYMLVTFDDPPYGVKSVLGGFPVAKDGIFCSKYPQTRSCTAS